MFASFPLQLRILWLREIKPFAQGHTVSKWQSRRSNPCLLNPRAQSLFMAHGAVSAWCCSCPHVSSAAGGCPSAMLTDLFLSPFASALPFFSVLRAKLGPTCLACGAFSDSCLVPPLISYKLVRNYCRTPSVVLTPEVRSSGS